MADITKVKLPNGTTYDIKDSGALPLTGGTVTGPVSFQDSTSMDEATIGDLIVNGGANFINGINATNYSGGQPIYIVKGTQTTTTASWTGEIQASKLYDGMVIAYYLPRTSASNVTLNLTLLDGTTTGAIPVYVTSTTRMTTHYGAGSTVYLTYWSAGSILINGTATTEARWTSNDYWDSNTYDRTYLSNSGYKAGSTAIVSGNIIVAGTDGLYKHLKAGTVFDTTMPILYASSAAKANAVNNGGYICIAFTVTTTQSITLTAYKPLFIKGTLSGVNFTPISTTPLTQTIPTSADNYQYIYLGYATTTTVAYLLPEHPIYEYRNGAFQRVVNDAKTVNSHTVLSDVPSGAKFTDTVTTATTTGSGNAVTAITASNGALTVTKGTTFLTSHQDISGKADKATTLAGYGITDAKIANGVITLGNNTITPLTSSSLVPASQTQEGIITTDSQWLAGVKGAEAFSAGEEGFRFFRDVTNASGSRKQTGHIVMRNRDSQVSGKDIPSKMAFRINSFSSSTGEQTAGSDTYFLPEVAMDKTSDSQNYILTTKNLVTIAQGGTNASTAAGARTQLGLTSVAASSWITVDSSDPTKLNINIPESVVKLS